MGILLGVLFSAVAYFLCLALGLPDLVALIAAILALVGTPAYINR